MGLDHTQVRAIVDMLQIPPSRWRDLMKDLQVVEREAIPLLNA